VLPDEFMVRQGGTWVRATLDQVREWVGDEVDCTFTYTSGVLTRIDYASGAYKTFSYDAGKLVQQDYVVGSKTTRKVFSYNPDGTLASVTQAVLL
jgi:hypothetical protein